MLYGLQLHMGVARSTAFLLSFFQLGVLAQQLWLISCQ